MKKYFQNNNVSKLNIFIYIFALFIVFLSLLNLFSKEEKVESLDIKEEVIILEDKKINLVFAGDISFDRYVRRQAIIKGNYNYIFDDVRDIFSSADLVVANSEGPTTNNPSRSMGSAIGSTSNYFFTFAPETATVMYDENLRLVNLGNNHIHNFGLDGLEQTKNILTQNNVDYFGHVTVNQEFKDEIFVKDFDGYRILFLNYNQFIDTDIDNLMSNISSVKNNYDFVILYTHWGLEYKTHANNVIQTLAHKFIDSGVDLIIGSHPHVVQQSEVYKDKTIYYSLGNFIFDQYFDNDVREGLLVKAEINIKDNSIEFTEYNTRIELDSSVTLIK